MQAPGIFMAAKESLRFQVISKYLSGILKRREVAQILEISERTVSRIAGKVEEKGVWGVKHGNLGKEPPFKYPDEVKGFVLNLLKTKYFDFNLAHFTDVLEKDYGVTISHQTIWSWASKMNMVKSPRVRRRNKRVVRTRMPQEGLLLQMDGSHHKWK